MALKTPSSKQKMASKEIKRFDLLYLLSLCVAALTAAAIFFIWNYPKISTLDLASAKTLGVTFNIERCSMTTKKIFVSGWAFIKTGNDNAQIYILMKNHHNGKHIVLPSRSVKRKDVGDFFKNNALYDNSGFSASLIFLGHADSYDNVITVAIKDKNGNVFKDAYACKRSN